MTATRRPLRLCWINAQGRTLSIDVRDKPAHIVQAVRDANEHGMGRAAWIEYESEVTH